MYMCVYIFMYIIIFVNLQRIQSTIITGLSHVLYVYVFMYVCIHVLVCTCIQSTNIDSLLITGTLIRACPCTYAKIHAYQKYAKMY